MAKEEISNSGHLVGRIRNQLRELILIGQLRPGEPVRQEQLAEKLNVSRTPLRTAMTELAHAGLLEYEPNRGYKVREFTTSEILASFELRAKIEGLAARLVARKGIDEKTQLEFEWLLEQGDAAIADKTLHQKDLPKFRNMNIALHKLIRDLSGNPWILEFIDQLQNIPLSSERSIQWDSHKNVRHAHDDHHRIVEQIIARNECRAEGLMVEHIMHVGEQLTKKLEHDPAALFRQMAEV